METLITDVKKVKLLLKAENESELKKMSTLFLPDYNAQILAKLDPFERNQWMRIHGYN